MKLNFRQGIVRARTTAQGTPDFLSLNQGSGIQINITNPTLLITLAHKDTNFLIEEVATAINGWGPFSWSSVWGSQPSTPIYHLYWDVNLATGEVTRGYTHSAPIVSSTNPLALLKVVGTHWFDLSTNVMKVSDGTFWVPVCRVFAGTYSPNVQSISHYPFGTQVGITSDVDEHVAGFIVLGNDQKAIRTADGELMTSETDVIIKQGGYSSPISLEALSTDVISSEPIPAFHCVTVTSLGKIGLASSEDNELRAVGIVDEDVPMGSATKIITNGVLFNEQWNWDLSEGKELYCGSTGELVQKSGSTTGQRIAFIITAQSIMVDLDEIGSGDGSGGPAYTIYNNINGPGAGLWTGVTQSIPGDYAPSNAVGSDGDFYLGRIDVVGPNQGAEYLFGPKNNGAWPVPGSLINGAGGAGGTGYWVENSSDVGVSNGIIYNNSVGNDVVVSPGRVIAGRNKYDALTNNWRVIFTDAVIGVGNNSSYVAGLTLLNYNDSVFTDTYIDNPSDPSLQNPTYVTALNEVNELGRCYKSSLVSFKMVDGTIKPNSLEISSGRTHDFVENTLLTFTWTGTANYSYALNEIIANASITNTTDYSQSYEVRYVRHHSINAATWAGNFSSVNGTGYLVDDIVSLAGGINVTPATFRVTAVSSGRISACVVVTPGEWREYPTGQLLVSGGSGTGCKFVLSASNFTMLASESIIIKELAATDSIWSNQGRYVGAVQRGGTLTNAPLTYNGGNLSISLAEPQSVSLTNIVNLQPLGYGNGDVITVTELPGMTKCIIPAKILVTDVGAALPIKSVVLTNPGLWQISSGPTNFLLDTFTGAYGTLISHVGEIGATWTSLSGEAAGHELYVDGSGSVQAGDADGSSHYVKSSGVPTGADFAMELDIDAFTTANAIDQVGIFAVDNQSNYYGFDVAVKVAASKLSVVTSFGDDAGFYDNTVATNVGALYYDQSTLMNSTATLRVELSNNRKTITVKLNGVTIDSHTSSTTQPMLEIGECGFYINVANTVGQMTVKRVSGESLQALTEIPTDGDATVDLALVSPFTYTHDTFFVFKAKRLQNPDSQYLTDIKSVVTGDGERLIVAGATEDTAYVQKEEVFFPTISLYDPDSTGEISSTPVWKKVYNYVSESGAKGFYNPATKIAVSNGAIYYAFIDRGGLGEIDTKFVVLKVSITDGSIIWANRYHSTVLADADDYGFETIQLFNQKTTDGSFYLALTYQIYVPDADADRNQVIVLKFDSLGEILWQTQLGSAIDIVRNPTGYIISGTSYSDSLNHAVFVGAAQLNDLLFVVTTNNRHYDVVSEDTTITITRINTSTGAIVDSKNDTMTFGLQQGSNGAVKLRSEGAVRLVSSGAGTYLYVGVSAEDAHLNVTPLLLKFKISLSLGTYTLNGTDDGGRAWLMMYPYIQAFVSDAETTVARFIIPGDIFVNDNLDHYAITYNSEIVDNQAFGTLLKFNESDLGNLLSFPTTSEMIQVTYASSSSSQVIGDTGPSRPGFTGPTVVYPITNIGLHPQVISDNVISLGAV